MLLKLCRRGRFIEPLSCENIYGVWHANSLSLLLSTVVYWSFTSKRNALGAAAGSAGSHGYYIIFPWFRETILALITQPCRGIAIWLCRVYDKLVNKFELCEKLKPIYTFQFTKYVSMFFRHGGSRPGAG